MTLVIGGPRLGKTSLLRQVALQVSPLAHYVDASSLLSGPEAMERALDDLDLRLTRSMRATLRHGATGLQVLGRQLHSHSPVRRLATLTQRLQGLPPRLVATMQSSLRGHRERLAAIIRELQAVSPLATMQRGYSVLRTLDAHHVIGSVGDIRPGEHLEALLADGRAELEALRTEHEHRTEGDD